MLGSLLRHLLRAVGVFAKGCRFRRWQDVPLLALYAGYYVSLVTFARHLIGG